MKSKVMVIKIKFFCISKTNELSMLFSAKISAMISIGIDSYDRILAIWAFFPIILIIYFLFSRTINSKIDLYNPYESIAADLCIHSMLQERIIIAYA